MAHVFGNDKFQEIHDSNHAEKIEESVLFRKDRWTLVIYYRYIAKDRPSGKILGFEFGI